MSGTTLRTIKVKKYSKNVTEYNAANGNITPGMLIYQNAAATVTPHDEADGNALPMFALEDEMIGGVIGTAYTSGAKVQCWIPARGDEVYAILASGENAGVGDWLSSNGDGKLKVLTDPTSIGVADSEAIVGQATEAVNAALVDTRIIVRIK